MTSYEKIPPVLAYHRVDNKFHWGVTRVTPKQFHKHLEYLKIRNYVTSSFLKTFSSLSQVKLKKRVIITFDDGFKCVYQHAYPLLRGFGFKATIFVVSDFVGRESYWDVNIGWMRSSHLNWDEIIEMKEGGFEIGSHTCSHPDLTILSSEELIRELKGSKEAIEDKINQEVNFLSLPFGRYNKRVLRFAQKSGYLGVCDLNPDRSYDGYVIGRKGVYLIDNIFAFKAKLERGWFSEIEKKKLKLINFFSRGTIIVKNL